MGDAHPVFTQLNIVASDVDAALEFYRRLGVDVPDAPASPDGIRHAEVVEVGGLTLEFDSEELAARYNAAWRGPGGAGRVVVGFRVQTRQEVDDRYAAMVAAGHEGRQPPYDTFWGARYAVLADPDGNDVGLMSPIDESRRWWPIEDSPDP